ncbi:MAG: selenocysteine-specific translation elongation factor [Terracidiphilus sp.]
MNLGRAGKVDMDEETLPTESGLNSTTKTIVIGTAGHIDHGKTALIRALTGVDTDRLPEEKKRGITIDLGFASSEVTARDGSLLRVSFIDVPGHARFVRNMLAGAGGIDAVMLVISAEEGVKPQTEEHLAICSLLGIQRGLTILTKIDAVDASRLSEVRASVEKFLAKTFLASEPVIGASAFTGAGLDELRHALSLFVERVPERNSESLMRFPLDRTFAMKGFGPVVTGTLISGSVEVGQELVVEPGNRRTKVRGIQVHGHAVTRVAAATRVALNLSRTEAADLQRGDTLVAPSTITAADTLDVEIILLADAPAMKHRARVHFHAFASECMATISLYDYQRVEPNSRRLARVRLSRPILLLPGDRFVLRQGSPITTVGGGVVLDAHPIHKLKKVRAHEWLRQMLHAATAEEQLALRVARRGTAGITMAELSAETGLQAEAMRARLGETVRNGSICSLESGLLLTREALMEASDIVQEVIERMLRPAGTDSVKRSELRSRVRLRSEFVDLAVDHLANMGRLRFVGEDILPPEIDRAATSRERQRLDAIDSAYRQAGLASPSPANLGTELSLNPDQMRHLITILLREGRLVRLGDDSLCVHLDALVALKKSVQALRGQTLDVSQFKLLAGVSRKYAIPLLEYLDRERVTRKQGDRRMVL